MPQKGIDKEYAKIIETGKLNNQSNKQKRNKKNKRPDESSLSRIDIDLFFNLLTQFTVSSYF
jgi:hypothetical protein